jgi:HSP20 family protein
MAENLIQLLHALFLPAASRFHEPYWRPAADVYRTSDGWLVKLDLAGVCPKEISVTVCGHQLKIRGCRRDWVRQEGQRHYRMEIDYSCFERSIELPCDLERAQIGTDYRDGMLLIRIEGEGQP